MGRRDRRPGREREVESAVARHKQSLLLLLTIAEEALRESIEVFEEAVDEVLG